MIKLSHLAPALLKGSRLSIVAILLIGSVSLQAAQKVGDQLVFVKESGGATLRVGVEENVASVSLEYRKPGAKTWTSAGSATNALGSLQMAVSVNATIRNQEFRLLVAKTRALPTTMAFTKDKAGKAVVLKKPAVGIKMSLEAFDTAAKQWKRVSLAEQTKAGADVTMPIPAKLRTSTLRVVALDPVKLGTVASRFPAAFRKGKTTFPEKVVEQSNELRVFAMDSAVADSSSLSKDATADDAVEEADIWRVLGKKIYFFNQLRGLQVIDTSKPKSPEIISSLRMPAVGEDMYVLAEDKALLVRRDFSGAGKTSVVLVNTSNLKAVVKSQVDIDGWYVDSRKVGDRLVVTTQSWAPPYYVSKSKVSVIENLSATPRLAGSVDLDRNVGLMGVTSEYIWIAGNADNSWWNSWGKSRVTLFPIKNLPSVSSSTTFDLGGVVYDKFKIHQNGKALFAVTQSWNSNWRSVTNLESYSLEGSVPTLLKSHTLVEGESLHATRFDGDRAYIVTFFQVDPLWIMDLSDPANPKVESELQVPGWSSYIQPMGDYLAAVGVEGGSLTASLFDVKDPANPSLASRVTIGDKGYTWSEANWNEKAVAILAEQNLILLPYQSYSWTDGSSSAVQLVDMNLATGTLVKRGVIAHAFQPRRATALQEGILASISNRELFLVDAANRDKPALLSEVTLAFGADRIVHADAKHIVHCEGGGWNGGNATLRVSTAKDADDVVSETLLSAGRVVSSGVQGNRMAVLVENSIKPESSQLVFYRLDKLPELVESGRATINLSEVSGATAQILWPYPDTIAVALRRQGWGWGWGGGYLRPMVMVDAPMLSKSVMPYRGWYGSVQDTVQLIAFDLSGSSPTLASTMKFDDLKPSNTSGFFSADGLVAFSMESIKDDPIVESNTTPVKPGSAGIVATTLPPVTRGFTRQRISSQLQVVDYADASKPSRWPTTTIPGKLEHITEWDRSAGLLFTSRANDAGGIALDALLYEAAQASAITSWDSGKVAVPFSFSARSLFVADSGLSRRDLSNDGQFTVKGSISNLPWQPDELAAKGDALLLRNGADIGAIALDLKAPLQKWNIPGWSWQLQETQRAGKAWVTPLGEYGLETIE